MIQKHMAGRGVLNVGQRGEALSLVGSNSLLAQAATPPPLQLEVSGLGQNGPRWRGSIQLFLSQFFRKEPPDADCTASLAVPHPILPN